MKQKIHFTSVFVLCLFICTQTRAQTKTIKHSAAIAARLDSLMLSNMKTLHIPGVSLAIVQDGKIIYSKGYGYANLELKIPAKPESNFLIASITKSFTAVALMILWEQGRFSLDDSIGKYLPDLPSHWNPLTIRQLLSHTAGIPSNLEPVAPCKFDHDPDNYTQADYLKEVACLPLRFQPGTKWEYSGSTGYTLMGMLIEKLSGETYWEYLQKNIFSPLGMNETGSIDYTNFIANRVTGYDYENDKFQPSVLLDPVGEFASGGLISTVNDLARFDAALYSNMLLQSKTLDSMFTPARLNDGTPTNYGIGFGLTPYQGQKRVGHTGGTPGFSSSFNRFISKKITVILLSNTNHPDYNVLRLSNEIAAFYF